MAFVDLLSSCGGKAVVAAAISVTMPAEIEHDGVPPMVEENTKHDRGEV
jgi:hypothetical protein